jgi:hypothetical protein
MVGQIPHRAEFEVSRRNFASVRNLDGPMIRAGTFEILGPAKKFVKTGGGNLVVRPVSAHPQIRLNVSESV